MAQKQKYNPILILLLFVGLVSGSFLVKENLYHYEKVEEVAHDDDEDSHEGHDHEKILTESEQYVQTANLDTLNADLQLQAGRSLHIKGEFGDAFKFYKRYESLIELNANIASEMGTLLWKLKPGIDAVKYFSKALKQDSLHVNSLYGLGIVSMTIGEKHSAEKYFAKVVQVEPNGELAKVATELINKIKK